MSYTYRKTVFEKFLQFFADGASGGDGGEGAGAAAPGENAADAGRDLEALGVPKEAAERHRKRMEKRGKAAAVTAPAQETQPTQNAAASAANDGGDSSEWDAFFARQENKDRLQQMMADRGKAATAAKQAADEQIAKMGPTLRALGNMYNIKPGEDGSYDLDAINKAVAEDDRYFEDKALEMGVSVDVARKLEQADELEQERKAAEAKAQRMQMLQEHFNKVQSQAKTLEELVPGFSLDAAMQDPEFVRRTAPGIDVPADEAYVGMHYREIMRQQAETIARLSKKQAAASVAAGGSRPRENGSAAAAPVSAAPNIHAMSKAERLAYIRAKYPSVR